jgi:hypothetical protein
MSDLKGIFNFRKKIKKKKKKKKKNSTIEEMTLPSLEVSGK